jgi:hypothetical protein
MSTDAQIRAAILELLRQRGPGKSICPSDAARAVAGEQFRPLMDQARSVAAELTDEGLLEVTRRGEVIHPRETRGAIRLRLRQAPPA